MHWRRKWQPTPVFLPGESQRQRNLVGCRLWGRTKSDTTKATKGNAKECSNFRTIALISHTSKLMLQILQPRLQQYMNRELPDVQAGFRKDRNQRSNCQHPPDHRKSKRVPEKHLFLLYWLCQILWLCGSQETVENCSRDGNTRPPDLPLEKPICRSGSKLELDMEQQTGSK